MFHLDSLYNWEIEKKVNCDCYQNILINIAKLWKCDLSMLYSLIWGFGYDKTKGSTIGERLSVGYRIRPYRFVAQYNGIDYGFVNINNYDLKEIYLFLKECKTKENVPVIVMNGINCPWTKFYKKTRIQHYAIINGMNSEGLVCVDPFSSNNPSEIYDYNILTGCKHKFILFTKCNKEENVNIDKVLKTLYYEVKDIPLEQLYQEFIDDIQFERMIAEMPAIEEAETFPFFISINLLVQTRANIASYFEDMFARSRKPECLEISKLFIESSKLWNKVKIVLLRFCILRTNKDLDIASNCIEQISKRERNILEILGKILL